jgi:hypothetical protein
MLLMQLRRLGDSTVPILEAVLAGSVALATRNRRRGGEVGLATRGADRDLIVGMIEAVMTCGAASGPELCVALRDLSAMTTATGVVQPSTRGIATAIASMIEITSGIATELTVAGRATATMSGTMAGSATEPRAEYGPIADSVRIVGVVHLGQRVSRRKVMR